LNSLIEKYERLRFDKKREISQGSTEIKPQQEEDQSLIGETTSEKGWVAAADLRNKYQIISEKLDEMTVAMDKHEKTIKDITHHNRMLEVQLENSRSNEKALLQQVEYTEQLYYESKDNVEHLNHNVSKMKRELERYLGSSNHTDYVEQGMAESDSDHDSSPTHLLISTSHEDNKEALVQLQNENRKLLHQNEELQRILDQTRDDLQTMRLQSCLESPRTPRVPTPREIDNPKPSPRRQEQIDCQIVDEWNKLMADKFESNLSTLKEQILKYEKRAYQKKEVDTTPQTFLEEYYRFLLLSVKLLLAKEPRYQNTVWYKIWCDIDSDDIYASILNNEIPIEEWWLFLFTTLQTRLEYARYEYEVEEELSQV